MKRTQTIILLVVGCVAGLSTCVGMEHGPLSAPGMFSSLGIVFSVFFALYAFSWEGTRSVWRIAGFIALTTVAFASATWAGVFAGARTTSNSAVFPIFLGGVVGSALVALGRYLFLADLQSWKKLLRGMCLLSLIGGVLGAVGLVFAPFLGIGILRFLRSLRLISPPNNAGAAFCSMFLVWQTCMAPLLVGFFPNSMRATQKWGK